MHPPTHDPVLTVALALAAGVLAQATARHLRVPGIVLLLGAGVVLGPDLLGWIRPEALGSALPAVTGLAVAIILFDGGLNLDRRRLRGQERVVSLLISVGALLTAAGGALAARLLLAWPWPTAALFGSLVTVTGPTVVTPLLRRLRVRRRLETILEAEGVLIDAVGAVLAVVTLEAILSPSTRAAALGVASAPVRLLAGLAIGAAGGGLLSLLLRWRRVVPEEHQNILSLAWAVLVFQAADVLVPESGLMAAIVAGAVVGNTHPRHERELKEFKEQLTTLVIGLLFILLAADVRVGEVTALGWRGLAVVGALMFVVRPLNVALCTTGSDLSGRERLLMAWLAPRGIVAAAVASLFHQQLAGADPAVGSLRALVFLVIAVTVVVQGGTAAPLARWLGLREPTDRGYLILGAHPLARLLARLLQEQGEEVVLVDNNARQVSECTVDGLRAVMGNGLEERTLRRARAHTRRAAVGLVSNEAVNLEFARRCRREMQVPVVMAALQRANQSLDAAMAGREDVRVLFGCEIDLAAWIGDVARERYALETWRPADGREAKSDGPLVDEETTRRCLPLVWQRGDRGGPVDETVRPNPDLRVQWAVAGDEGRRRLRELGWEPVAGPAAGESPPSAAT